MYPAKERVFGRLILYAIMKTVVSNCVQVVEGDYKYAKDKSMSNIGAALMLVQWLPDIHSLDLQVFNMS